MKIFKKLLSLSLTLLLAFFVFACGEYTPAVNSYGGGSSMSGLAPQPELDDDPTNDFTVRLRLNEQAYVPKVAVNVYWNDGYSVHVAPIDEQGVATIDGLDGDYTVTLSAAPSGYAYDPNAYRATNESRDVIIDMYEAGAVNAKTSSLYNAHKVNSTGVYTVTITEDPTDVNEDGRKIDVAYFEFSPQINGVYTIESWVNIADDEVNPVCLAYLGSFAYKHGEYTVTTVGACGSYTRNFIHTVKIADENIGNGGGSQSFTFAITAETKSGVYPVTFSFAIKRDGGFDYEHVVKKAIMPAFDWSDFDFDAFDALAGGTKVSAKTLYAGTTDSYVFAEYDYEREKYNYKVWEKSDGGDGLYHVYDEEKYAANGGYGPILFAYIKTACEYLEKPIADMHGAGNPLTVSEGTEDYQQFIRGFLAVAQIKGEVDESDRGGGGYYCVNNCPCHQDGEPLACLPGCQTCTVHCNPCPIEFFGKEGYADWCNDDGVVPVTPELKEFLQKFSISGGYFADGEGHVDRNGVYAYEDSQWLFACGYYE